MGGVWVPPGGVPGQVPPGGSGTPPGGGTQSGQQKEYSLHGGRYASCVHAGGLSCVNYIFTRISFLQAEKSLMYVRNGKKISYVQNKSPNHRFSEITFKTSSKTRQPPINIWTQGRTWPLSLFFILQDYSFLPGLCGAVGVRSMVLGVRIGQVHGWRGR